MARNRHDAVADREILDAVTQRSDDTGNLAAWRERTRRLELVFVLDDEHVGVIDRACAHADQQLSGGRDRRVDVAQLKRFGSADADRQ